MKTTAELLIQSLGSGKERDSFCLCKSCAHSADSMLRQAERLQNVGHSCHVTTTACLKLVHMVQANKETGQKGSNNEKEIDRLTVTPYVRGFSDGLQNILGEEYRRSA